jgi:predicted nucleic acid-binding protein
MSVYCDTSFFLHRMLPSPHRESAIRAAMDLEGRLGFVPITEFTRFESIQALRFEAWLHKNDRTKGFPYSQTEAALNVFLAEIGSLFRIQSADWPSVFKEAQRQSRTTPDKGWRTADLVHVACAVTDHALEFYSFDHKQNLLAASLGLKTPLLDSASNI